MKVYRHTNYEEYRKSQLRKYYKKQHVIFASPEELRTVAEIVKTELPDAKFGICHGVRTGWEVWYLSNLLPNVKVIGTDIANVDNPIGGVTVVQWDFHEENPEWKEKADFVYSNSWDHSYDIDKAFSCWVSQLRPGGFLFIPWTEFHSGEVDSADCLSATLEELIRLLKKYVNVETVIKVEQWQNPKYPYWLNLLRILFRRRPIKSVYLVVGRKGLKQ